MLVYDLRPQHPLFGFVLAGRGDVLPTDQRPVSQQGYSLLYGSVKKSTSSR
jgi:hypothetical protein